MSANEVFSRKFKLTGKAKLQAETERAVKLHMEETAKDKLLLLAIVTGGLHHYRILASKAFRGFLISDQMVEQMFQFFVEIAGAEPVKQYDELQRSGLVALKLEKLQGLARFINSEKHLDEVVERWVEPESREAIRQQLRIFWRAQQERAN